MFGFKVPRKVRFRALSRRPPARNFSNMLKKTKGYFQYFLAIPNSCFVTQKAKGNIQRTGRRLRKIVENTKAKILPSFICEICLEPKPLKRKFKNSTRCVHPFCTVCIAEHVHTMVENEFIANILCPGLMCDEVLDPLSCRPIVAANLFVKWCELLCESSLSGFEKSYCANRNCEALIVSECGETFIGTECPKCRKQLCQIASDQDNKPITERNEELFMQLMRKNMWTKCPGCNHCVELVSGCHEVVCRCNTKFCYGCGGKLPECQCVRKRLVQF